MNMQTGRKQEMIKAIGAIKEDEVLQLAGLIKCIIK
jgi:hypothetical protein